MRDALKRPALARRSGIGAGTHGGPATIAVRPATDGRLSR
ncbi:hypothetical protein BURMUCGD2M_4080 [Burkholderia multivorans CGD2M]|uniref:Uncharacterized protein n=1 Tax=Burkholderia multivorans CGD2 TaxID=513052 RepID=B9BRS4_9BURK|nr:hypothetical protein BURMUCGD2_4091 [Burkholderia multivorans CGD2]EEE12116.1 hypothetical protein BURMUCGD2M_4080 [Burkholderia multivorans CGD2M]